MTGPHRFDWTLAGHGGADGNDAAVAVAAADGGGDGDEDGWCCCNRWYRHCYWFHSLLLPSDTVMRLLPLAVCQSWVPSVLKRQQEKKRHY